MAVLKIALLQMAPSGTDQDLNLARATNFCRLAAASGADLALFPEMWNIGYTFPELKGPEDLEGWQAQGLAPDAPYLQHFRHLAQELNLALAVTYLQRWPGLPRNAVTLFDRRGREILTYAKVHTCEFGSEKALTPGDDFYVGDLETASGSVRLGAMICYDREFPESARILMLKGAEIILVPNACEMELNRLAQCRSRAYENMTGLALANYPPPVRFCNGHSVAFDGIAYGSSIDPNLDSLSRDMLIVEAGPQEGLYLASFDLEALRHYRSHEIWGNSYRRPSHYSLLTSSPVEPPFIRPDATR